jgi:hypothetical protein
MERAMADTKTGAGNGGGGRPDSEDVGKQIDAAEPSEAVKRAIAKDMEAHLPADRIPGQTAQEPQVISQKESQDEGPGNY